LIAESKLRSSNSAAIAITMLVWVINFRMRLIRLISERYRWSVTPGEST